MKIIYIASPYTKGDVAENVHIQIEAAHRILDIGHCPIAPLLSHYLHIHRQRPHEDWMKMDLAILPTASAIIRLPGESPGADREVAFAKQVNIPVFHTWSDLEDWLEQTNS